MAYAYDWQSRSKANGYTPFYQLNAGLSRKKWMSPPPRATAAIALSTKPCFVRLAFLCVYELWHLPLYKMWSIADPLAYLFLLSSDSLFSNRIIFARLDLPGSVLRFSKVS